MTNLTDRIESATGPDRNIDAELAVACDYFGGYKGKLRANHSRPGHVNGAVDIQGKEAWDIVGWDAPLFTASLDAAMTLVLEGMWWKVAKSMINEGYYASVGLEGKGKHRSHDGATPALALCAAAMKAREEVG